MKMVYGIIAVLALSPTALAQYSRAKMQEAFKKITPVMQQAEELVTAGKYKESNDLVLSVFPEATRTPTEKLVLGNVLFKMDPELSYKFHKEAAIAFPDTANALFEWALEQHRAKEYAEAAKNYEAYLKLQPEHAPAYGLAAECRIRTNDIDGAIEYWMKSEKATGGSLEDLESMVCEVNGSASSNKVRTELLEKAVKGDPVACEELLLLDCNWETDWWNTGPKIKFLKLDLKAIANHANSNPRVQAARCLAECLLAAEGAKPDPEAILKKYSFVVDKDKTLPENGKTLALLLRHLVDVDLLDRATAQEQMGNRILEQARKTKDAEVFNAAAYLAIGTDRIVEIDEAAMKVVSDPRFNTSLLAYRMSKGKIGIDDPLLTESLKKFPEHSEIARFALAAARDANKPLEPYLINAIKAEYTHFSAASNGLTLTRPRANTLRAYFQLLAKERAEGKGANPSKPVK